MLRESAGYQRLIVRPAQVFVRAKPILGPDLAITSGTSAPFGRLANPHAIRSRANRAIETASLLFRHGTARWLFTTRGR